MRRQRLVRMAMVGMCTLLLPADGHADLFDTARRAVRVELGQADTTGVTLRGGASLASGQRPTATTLLRGRGDVGGGCGAFDFKSSLAQAFDDLPETFEGLLQNVLTSMPMLVLCYVSPTLCDLAKHWQALVNAVLQAKYAQCQQIQQTMAYAGLRLRGGHTSQCLEYQVGLGIPISTAMDNCVASVVTLRTPGGTQAHQLQLVAETLQAAGASRETQTLATALLGEVTLRANQGRLGTAHDRPQAALLQRYEGHRQEAETALRQALDELRTTGTVTAATLRALSVPGQPLPRAALEALVTLQQDPVRYDSLVQKVTTGLAITRLTWECHDLQDQLAASTEANQELTDEQRRLLEKRLEGLQRDLQQVIAKKEVLERHLQPALDALLTEYTAVQDSATRAGLRAPAQGTPVMPYRTQAPAGYGR